MPTFTFSDADEGGRDTSKPVAYDEHGQPLYAPRGIMLREWW